MLFSEHADQLVRPDKGFYFESTSQPNEEQVISGILNIPSKSQESGFTSRFFVLTPTRLYCCSVSSRQKSSRVPQGYVNIQWKVFIPYVGCGLYWFKLGIEGYSREFHAASEEELDAWTDAFSKVSILTGVRDDYNFEDMIGKGSYGVVHRAFDTNDDFWAIKSINMEQLRASSSGYKTLINEIECMRKLGHPNILRLESVYEEADGQVYLVLEYLDGGDLFSRVVRENRLNERYCAVIARRLLEALAYMGERRIIHRDLKLENLMLVTIEEEPDIKIVDFGLAAEMSEENLSMFCGSPGYCAPEILRNQPYDNKADIFSAGVVLFIILTGNSPFNGRDPNQVIESNLKACPLFDPSVWSSLSLDALNFIKRLIHKNRRLRPTAAEALAHNWIRSNNQQHYEDLEASSLRPTYSKRRSEVSTVSPVKSQAEGSVVLDEAGSSEESKISSAPTLRLQNPITFQTEAFVEPTQDSDQQPPDSPCNHSPTRSPVSARANPGRPRIAWKQIRPHR
jgi:serine/threonine protein kinase